MHANGAISGEENGGGVYIVKKVENEKTILCKALSKNLTDQLHTWIFQWKWKPGKGALDRKMHSYGSESDK